jgi:hypothetical protein
MVVRPRIGVACPAPGERAVVMDWLKVGGFDPVAMASEASVARELDDDLFEALILDADLVSAGAVRMMRNRGVRRPLIILVNAVPHAGLPKDATLVTRPLSRDELMLAVSLALAEGRPARRSPRLPVPRLHSTIDGTPAQILDVSNEGVRLELSDEHRGAVKPFFTLRVPAFNVAVVVQRIWVTASPAAGKLWCGASLAPNAAASLGWKSMLETAGTSFRNSPTAPGAGLPASRRPKPAESSLQRSLAAWLEKGRHAVQRTGW